MADLIRLATLDGQVFGAGILVALTWLILTVKALDSKLVALDSKVAALDSKVAGLANDVAFLRGRQADHPDGFQDRPQTAAGR